MILFSLLGNNTKQANNTREIYNNVLFFITIIGITELVISVAFEKECFNCVDKSYIHTYTYIHTYIHTYTYIYIHIHTYTVNTHFN